MNKIILEDEQLGIKHKPLYLIRFNGDHPYFENKFKAIYDWSNLMKFLKTNQYDQINKDEIKLIKVNSTLKIFLDGIDESDGKARITRLI